MYSIDNGESKIYFEVKRKKVKNINLRINHKLEITVSANNHVPIHYIKEFVSSKAKWIEKNLNYYENIERTNQDKKENVNGESLRYLGRDYRLKVFKSSDEYVKYFRGSIHLYTKDLEDTQKKENVINRWYKQRSEIIFKESLEKMYELVKLSDIKFPKLNIRKMKSRWGTCYYKNNKIIINSVLIKAPKDCIDYVILHELIHFKHNKHDNDFYKLLSILMPDWKDRKRILDEVVAKEL